MPRRYPIVLLLAVFLAASAQAQERPGPAQASDNIGEPQEHRTLFSRIRGLFDIDLPEFDPPGTFRLRFNPHLGDLFRRRYLRVSTGVEWAATEYLQIRADADVFGTHGFRRGKATFGVGQIHLGGKYLLREWLRPEYETSVGVNIDLPTGHPPLDFTDGQNHYSPYIILQHHSETNPHLTTFYGASFDIITPSSVEGTFGRNQPREDSVSLNTGAVYDLGQIKWTLQGTYQTTALIGGGHADHYFTLRPSMLWFVPKRYTFNGKTQWILGLGARATWGPDGSEFSTNTRLQAELTFGQVVERIRSAVDFRR